jgi:hypothetical protein
MSAYDPIVVLSPTVTVDTAANATGDNIGGKLTITDAVALDRRWGMIRSVVIISDTILLTTSFDVFFFDADLTTVITTNGAQTLTAADQAKVIGVAHCSDVTADGGCTVHQAQNLSIPFRASNGTDNIYATIVVRGTPTFAATTDVVLRVSIQQQT